MSFPWILLQLLLLLSLPVEVASQKREVLVKEVVLDSAVADIVYLGKNHECVLVTTRNKKLYFSQDSGQTWSEISEKVDPSPSMQVDVERVIVNPTDKTVAVLQTKIRGTARPYIYITEDSGNSWRRAWGNHHGLHSWISHPTERSWALVSWWNGACSTEQKLKQIGKGAGDESDNDEEEGDDSSKPCVHRLMLTKDLGKNFLQIGEYVVQFSWGSPTHQQTNRVYFTSYRSKSGDQGRLSLWTTEVDFNYIDIDKKGRPKKVEESLRHGNKFLVSNEFVLVAKVSSEAAQTVHLMVSKDGAKTFNAALLPSGMGELEEKWYTVLDTSEGEVILHLNSDIEGEKDTGRIFISDSGGFKFSQSLVNNVRSAQGECEFDKVVSLQGVYMANIVVPRSGTSFEDAKVKAAEEVEDEAAGGSQDEKKHGRGANKGKSFKSAKDERTIRTVVSFDKGGAWSYLKAPRVDSLGKPYDCAEKPAEECALHLHGSSTWDFYAPFYSMESSVGIIMGTGNVGPSLRFEPEVTNTFLSRDGGLTWMEAHQGAFIYEFGDHGGVIVMADDLKKTSQVVFTWNEGQSWFDFTVSATPFDVDNVITEPNLTATTFVMFGTREEGAGVLYYMAFDALQFPSCQGVWAADSVSSDYETWKPSDGISTEKCLLGQSLTYTRRKPTSQCFNGEKFERPVVQKQCACTMEDYGCNMGFVRSVGSTECVYGGPDMMPASLLPSTCGKVFQASPYRKIAGDKCEGGWSPSSVDLPCPNSGQQFSYAKQALIGILSLGGLYVAYGQFCADGRNSPGFGEFRAKSSGLPQCSLMSCIALVGSFLALFSSKSRSFGGQTYRPVKSDEFDMDAVGNDDSLNDFLDQADYDTSPPQVYGSAANGRRPELRPREEERRPRRGGAHTAREQVPKLQAPSVAPVTIRFDPDDNEDLL